MRPELLPTLESIRNPSILVIGDLMLDLYVWGDVARISPEAPVQIMKVESEEYRPGGAGNVAANLAALGAKVFCAGIVGDDANGRLLKKLLRKLKVDASGIIPDKNRPTTIKTRMLAQSQQLLRVDREEVGPIDGRLQSAMLAGVRSVLGSCDAVLISDYGKGSLSDEALKKIVASCRASKKPVLIDPAPGRDVRAYRGCTLLKPNRAEAAAASGREIKDRASLEAAARKLLAAANSEHLVITQGSDGLTVFGKGAKPAYVRGLSRPVYDITGAGDTILSLLGYVIAGGGSVYEAGEIANVAGGIVVGKLGATPVSRAEIIRELLGIHDIKSHKVKTLSEIPDVVNEHRRRRQRIVFTNGCFDLLHVGHIKLFQFCKNNGDILIAGLNSDSSVRKLKGQGRPVLNQEERAYILSALEPVDYIVIFGESTPLKLIRTIKPDVLVKGADYTRDTVVGRDFVESYGGRVELAPIVDGVSSSGIMSRIAGKGSKPARKRRRTRKTK